MKTLICLLVTLLVEIGFGLESIVTPQQEKAGVCPPVKDFSLGSCSRLCKSDDFCENNLKCCPTGCNGFQCKVPDEKAGFCPSESTVTNCDSTNTCDSDSKCEGHLKCCPSSCGKQYCQAPQEHEATPEF